LDNVFKKRNEKLQEKKSCPDFWLRVLTNHGLTKDFISEDDKKVLKFLKDLKYSKSENDNVIKNMNFILFYSISISPLKSYLNLLKMNTLNQLN